MSRGNNPYRIPPSLIGKQSRFPRPCPYGYCSDSSTLGDTLDKLRRILFLLRNPIVWTLGKRVFSVALLLAFFGLSGPGIFWKTNPSWANASSPGAHAPLIASSTEKKPSASRTMTIAPSGALGEWNNPPGNPSLLTKDGLPVIHMMPAGPILDATYIPEFVDVDQGRYVTDLDGGYKVYWTINPSIQSEVGRFIRRNRVPYGMFVAVDPRTGDLLALYGSHYGRQDNTLVQRATYPAASLFKVVTTDDALVHRKINPETRIYFHGCLYCIGPSYWRDNPRRDRLHLSVTEALGKSVNMIFAKIALRWLSPQNLQKTADGFGFNRVIESDIPFDPSQADIPLDRDSFARTAAGFGQVMISPIHAALISGALSNGGIMMVPHVIHSIVDPSGKVIYREIPRPLLQVTDPKSAWTLLAMMHSTTIRGTGRRAFIHWHYDPLLRHIEVAGKTGTLSGMHPAGHYEWFMGMAPLGNPRIAVAALSIDLGLWRIKGPDIASHGMIAYFHHRHSF